MSIKLIIKEKDKIIKDLLDEIINKILEEEKGNEVNEINEINLLKERLEKEEENIDRLEEYVEELTEKLEETKLTINEKLDKILNLLNGNVKTNCQKMSQHIDFVDNVYNTVKNPLGFLVEKMNIFIGDNMYNLENNKNKEYINEH
jgi:predicted RNase H-like nuclease (RuvC/YqgF family)